MPVIVMRTQKIEMRIVCQTMLVCLFEGIEHCAINV